MQRYKAAEIIELTGITKMQLNHWINMGVIRPAEDDSRRGGVRYFSKENLFEALVCKYLNAHRLPVQAISGVVLSISNPAPIRKGKSFFKTFKDNQELGDYFLIVAHHTFYAKKGIKDFLSSKQEISEHDKKEIYNKSRIYEGCTADELSENISKYPTAIVISLTSIAREAINM